EPQPAVRVELRRGAAAGPFDAADDGFGDRRFPGAEPAAAADPANTAPANAHHGPAQAEATEAAGVPLDAPGTADAQDQALAAIRAENLTSRQLRMAMRIAAMHQIEAASEYEAVLRLRQRGIDPFHRSALGRILSEAGDRAGAAPSPQAPVPVPGPGLPARTRRREIEPLPAPGDGHPGLPSREALTEERRAAEIYRIQRDIARRRRKRLGFLLLRLAFFVGLPTLIAGWYYHTQATPLYATHSQFLIQQADGGFSGEGGGLLSASPMATNPDSVSVQSYLTSRAAMLRLDNDLGFTRAFQDPAVDALLRLPPDATNEQAYGLYERSVKIGYDPTEGVINMEVIAPDPALSEQFSLALIGYAEGQVDQMSARLRDDQMKGAMENYADAERKVLESQARIQELQEQLGVLDPAAESGAVMGRISALESQLADKRLELGQLQSNLRPNQSRVLGVQGDISRLEQMIAETRAQLTTDSTTRGSLAAITGQLRIAESDLATRQQLLASAAQQMEAARVEANKQVRYLSLSMPPVPPDEATYPKAFQNTLVAFLIFGGIYLMLSLTVSILREQVSS
ncbi:capsule biosynthesis protein, partial [Paracoccus solventivorans]|uniref:capsule biosynthesis protein n=1 Tax=Paracoccus solventivorans TaxID=53463 RepID=UPI00350E45D1